MKKSLTIFMVVVMLFCMMPVFGIFAESSDDQPTLDADVDTNTMSVIPLDLTINRPVAQGITPWGGEEVVKMFDGKYGIPDTRTDDSVYGRTSEEKGTKLGGQVNSGEVTVTFSSIGASKVESYTLYTGFDSGLEAGRNPIAWTFYGMGETDWVEIHKVDSPNMQDVNCTPFSYQVPAENVGEYTDYMMVFTAGGAYFQLNELVLQGTSKLNSNVDPATRNVIAATNPVAEGITPWGGEEADKLFDGKYGVTSDDPAQDPYTRTDDEKGTKLGGQVTSEDKKVTVSFSTAGENAIEYYTFVTGFDATKENGRNPIAWTLYALKGNGDWVALHEVAGDENIVTGLEDINCGSYTYAVPKSANSRAAYTDYKFEFTAGGDYFQMNEVILLGAAIEVDTPDTTPGTDETPAGTTAATTTTAAPQTTVAPQTTQAPTSTGDTTNNTSDNDSNNGSVGIIVAVVAAVVVVAAIVIIVVATKKKKA